MTSVAMYFQVHQPFRLRKFSFFDRETDPWKRYFDHEKNEKIFRRVASKCYYPANEIILDLVERTEGKFRVTFSLTGTFIEQAEMYEPELIESFRELVKTGAVEMLDETYYHSFAALWDWEEFKEQVRLHRKKMWELFRTRPQAFRNTEGLFFNELGKELEKMGYKGAVVEGADRVLGWRSPNYVYRPVGAKIKILPRNYRLSDDVGFRFASPEWKEYPLTAEKYAAWLKASGGDVIGIFMDYETFGEHMWPVTGIFEFLKALPFEVFRNGMDFVTVSEAFDRYPARDELNYDPPVTWADMDRDLSAWLSNELQWAAFNKVKGLKSIVLKVGDSKAKHIWRLLQTSDHFYYMSLKYNQDGDIHAYFRNEAFDTPYDAFMTYMNTLQHFEDLLVDRLRESGPAEGRTPQQ
ncbi:MAG TPA: alpha-amylase [Euryarchaeota archaeon]|nr:alpha-amylase [Euryarchaeota archaeon]